MIARDWVKRDLEEPLGPKLRNNFHTRLIIEGHRTPSGQAYDFQLEEEKDDVLKEDIDYLLSLVYQQSGCCGGQPGEPINYFVMA